MIKFLSVISTAHNKNLYKPGRPANNELWQMFHQWFSAEGIMLSDNNKWTFNYKFGIGYKQTKFYFQACINAYG